jgi:anti-anti-sigma regulatory factor
MVTERSRTCAPPILRSAPPAAAVLPRHCHADYRTTLVPPAHGYARAVCGDTVVELHGEIGITTLPAVTADLDAATDRQRPRSLVDLSVVTFIYRAGLEPICPAQCRALERACRPALVCSDPRTGRHRSNNPLPAPKQEMHCRTRSGDYAAYQVPRVPRPGCHDDCCASAAVPPSHRSHAARGPVPCRTCFTALDRTANRGTTPIPSLLKARHHESADRHDAHRRGFQRHNHPGPRPSARPAAVIRDVR